MLKYKRWLRPVIVAAIVAVGLSTSAFAATDNQNTDNIKQAVAESYATAKPLQQGLIVQLKDKSKTNVEPATFKNLKKMFGVVVAADDTTVNLSTMTGDQLAYVVTSGRYNVLVSNQNGSIAANDYITMSAIDGIGMKADSNQETILGRAIGGFNGKDEVLSTTDLKTSDNKQIKAAIGSITVDINIGASPLHKKGENGVPSFIQDIAIGLVGKPIGAAQLYASAAVLLAGIGMVASLLYGGIQTGMTAIGRNPLARTSIMRNMIQVIVTGVVIFIGCLVAVYLILKI